MTHTLIMLALVGYFGVLVVRQAAISVWAISCVLLLLLDINQGGFSYFLALLSLGCVLGSITPLRRNLISKYVLQIVSKNLPVMSSTEREALDAGTVGYEGSIFSGAPDFQTLQKKPYTRLTEEEQAFIDGPVNTLCGMINEWDITHNLTDLPEPMWRFIKENRFFGMIIPKSYGGLEFSATAQMSILTKLYSRSITVATTISVPNSLGPGELLLKYGTEEQKDHYLPRLADGREIPCFALTSPDAGSDAASIPDTGIVCKGEYQGKEIIGVRLNWNKRYITLCPVATVIGLAFHMYDPEHLLGDIDDIGISLALIPANTKGVVHGRRHFPLNIAFMNGPTQGKDVFVPLDHLIGGVAMIGRGWKMLMECLSAGRAISLPSSANGGGQAISMGSGAYARVRRQFNMPISNFEGIEEPLARIAGNAYIIDSAITMTCSAVDQGEKPSVASAILKYHTTELLRTIIVDAMDVHGGKGICLGPNNYLGRAYQGVPIGITVEGANILTRSLIIFGQGAVRCHPYVFKEMESARSKQLVEFDKAFFGHVGFTLANFLKSFIFAWTDARFTKTPTSSVSRYYQLVHKYSSFLAFLSDFSMIILGGSLKRKEKLSARLGDMLSYLYMASAVLKRFYEDGEPESDRALVEWSCLKLLHQCEAAMHGVIVNFPFKWGRVALSLLLKPLGVQRHQPNDHLGHRVARILTTPNAARARLSRHTYHESNENCPLGKMEEAFHLICAVEDLEKKVLRAAKDRKISSLSFAQLIEDALKIQLITADEASQLRSAEAARQEVIRVDDFSDEELRRGVPLNKSTKKVAVKSEVTL